MDVASFVDQGSENSIATETNDSTFNNAKNSIVKTRSKDIQLVIYELNQWMQRYERYLKN